MAEGGIANSTPAPDEVLRWFDELRDPLRRYLMCAGAHRADADEAVQETFLKLYLQFRKNTEVTNVRAWVFAVARNCVRDARKSARYQRTVALGDAPAEGNPERDALLAERSLRLGEAVGRLPERERECILLRSSGMRYREIAEILGIETNSVGAALHRAVMRLREELR